MFLRNKISYLAIGAVAVAFLVGALFFNYEKNNAPEAQAALTDNVMGFAWSENIGWISFNSLNCDLNNDGFYNDGGANDCLNDNSAVIDYGVSLNVDNTLSGYAWSSNIGWISFEAGDVAGCPTAPCQPSLSGSDFSGWARALANGGGWDGWINLRNNAIPYGVSLNGIDFEGFAWSDMVIGWISFNSKNCDTDNNTFIDAGACGGDNATTSIVNYKVYLGNNRPVVSSLAVDTDYCANGINSIKFKWNFDDDEDGSGNQTAYQVDLTRDAIGPACSVNGAANLFVTAGDINISCAGFIDYGHSYDWTVIVEDSGGLSSIPVSSTFNSPSHRYPTADFNYNPLTPVPQFQDIDFDPSPSQTFGGSSIDQWTWDFGDGTAFRVIIPPLTGDTTYFYTEPDNYTVDLEITDSDGNNCWASDSDNAKDIDIELSKPTWNEVEPES